ncbi:hypothetical protein LTR08_008062 [Meristemomyces frigidus]|nr:hypothetical protein LTR08_008062 [Meristemomyces frigidus]
MSSPRTEFIVSPPAAGFAKSPPLAFAPTSNDSLLSRLSPPYADTNTSPLSLPSPSRHTMGLTSPQAPGSEQDLQLIVDQQANALHLLHDAFAAERRVWSMEKGRLYSRIASLEQLLKTRDHYSPAKSPTISPASAVLPTNSGVLSIASPLSRAMTSRLPIIAEDENVVSLSHRRSSAPRYIDLPGRPPALATTKGRSERSRRESSVSFDGDIKVDDGLRSPPSAAKPLSPVPFSNRMMAGHTPVKAARRQSPPPLSMAVDGSEDTPTRANTHLNLHLTQSNDEENDVALKGPLNMPELPNRPDETNFTFEALAKRLEQIEQHPEKGLPSIYAEPSPGMLSMSPADISEEAAAAKQPEEKSTQPDREDSVASNVLSQSAIRSPKGAPGSREQSHDDHNLENGGIKLKRKPSVNFGAPLGQLGGFAGSRRLSLTDRH